MYASGPLTIISEDTIHCTSNVFINVHVFEFNNLFYYYEIDDITIIPF